MKNLRQLLLRSGLVRTEKRRGRPEPTSRGSVSRRRLSNEALERRELLAGDLLASNHNVWAPYDVNADGQYSARDALAIINYMGKVGTAEGELLASDQELENFYDVNADNRISAADALGVINALGRGEGVGEVTELLLNARTNDDQLIVPDANGDVNVNVGEAFYLEVSYNELRFFDDRLGVFQLFTDLSVSQQDVLEPILNETQRLIVGEEIRDNNSGTLTFGIEGSATTYESSWLDFATNSRQEVVNALSAFGYSSDEYTLRQLDFGNDDVGFEIHWVGDEFGDVDLPDITMTGAFPVPVPTQTVEFAPRLPGGEINTDAVRFNIDTFSRTFNNNEQFYSTNNRGEFDASSGFTDVGGIGLIPAAGGGIPDLTDDGGFITPFDAFSLRVKLTSAVTDFVVGVTPGTDPEAVLLYGEDTPVPSSMILVDEDARVTFNGIGVADPFDAGNGSLAVTEDIANSIDLSTLITGGPAESFAVVTNGSIGVAAVAGSTLTYTPNADENGSDTVVYSATFGGVTEQGTITVNVAAENDPPVANDDSVSTTTDVAITIELADLLANDTTGAANEADTLTIIDVSDPTTAGATTSLSGVITYTPAAGFVGLDTFTYTLSDGEDTDTATVTVNVGLPPAPIAGDGNLAVTEDVANSIDLSTLLSGGPFDTLTVVTDGSLGSANISGTTLTYTPSADENGVDTIVYRATSDSGSDDGTITVNIAAENDPPVANPDAFDAIRNTPLTIQLADLTGNDETGAANENDTLTVISVSDPANSGAMTALNGVVTYTPAADFEGTDTFTYTISDGEDTDTATVTITVAQIAPIADDGTTSAPENGSGQIDLATLLSGGVPDDLQITTDPTRGTASLDGTVLTYSPNVGVFDGTDTIVYTATNTAGTDTGTITVTITDVNLPPVGGAPVLASFSEEDGPGNVLLLTGASDPDGDDLNVTGLTVVSGNAVGIVQNGNSLDVDPDAYGFLGEGDVETVVYSYSVTDGEFSDSKSATITINGFNDPPRARDDNGVVAFVDVSQDIDVLANDDAGVGEEDQELTVVSATSSDGNATVAPTGDGSAVAFTPDPGFIGDTSFTYTVRDAGGKESTATVNVTVKDFIPSSIEGDIFIDHVENLDSVIGSGASPVRNGVKDPDEAGLGSVHVRLFSAADENTTGSEVDLSTVTNLNGAYGFDEIAPGTYTITAMIDGSPISSSSTKVVYAGPSEFEVGIALEGGEDIDDVNFALWGTSGSALATVDILASSYLRTNPELGSSTNGGREGGLVSLAADGSQSFFIAGEGFEGVAFAELALNHDRDRALLTILEEDGDILTARLDADEFVVSSGDGLGVQFFGGLDDHDFVEIDDISTVRAEYAQFRQAIDEVLSGS